jgi:hypothetical protein
MKRAFLTLLITGWLVLNAPAGVLMTKLNPPLRLYPALGEPRPQIDIDFNQDQVATLVRPSHTAPVLLSAKVSW